MGVRGGALRGKASRDSCSLRGSLGSIQGDRDYSRSQGPLGARKKALAIGDEFCGLARDRAGRIFWSSLIAPRCAWSAGSSEDLTNFGATYGSIFPAIELLMLSARALGLGTAVTTMLSAREPQTKALFGVRISIN